MSTTRVILVNEQDQPVGFMDKMEAHQKGVLHRAFSVFLFDKKGRMLLQQRAKEKYHGALLWTNACCSHPHENEKIEDAAQRRMKEELGMTTPLKKIFCFTYQAAVENELIEHEYDHVFAGEYEGNFFPDPKEIAEVEYRELDEIKSAMYNSPENFTSWFRIAFPRV
ncbi:MAG: isopentenyl-diphosphate Delta-isomerase, partial [Flavisolibacter sp.]